MAGTLIYFPLRGRGEVLRLALELSGESYEEKGVDYTKMKEEAGSEEYPFGQAPVFIDGDLHIPQMDAILRHLGRKFNLYGSSDNERTIIDAILIGVESQRTKYLELVYQHQLNEQAKKDYVQNHLSEEGVKTRNSGAHFRFLENYLKRNNNGAGWAVGNAVSIADIHLFDIVDLHLREVAFPQEIKKNFPVLFAHYERFAAQPKVKAYLESDKRPSKVNGNGLG